MPLYEITNPSDPYTIRAELRQAAIATLFLGVGTMGLETETGETAMPLFLLGGHEEWCAEQGIDINSLPPNELRRVADALDTVMIGTFRERAEAESVIAFMRPDIRQAWLAGRHDRRRSSMNDIGGKAERLAACLRERADEMEVELTADIDFESEVIL